MAITSSATAAIKTAINDNLKQQAIFRDKHDKNFTIIGNETLDIHIPGDPITAYEIHKVLLKMPPTFKPKTKWICERFGVSEDVIGPKMTRLSNIGLAKHEREIDPVTKKIIGHYWVIYESPQKPQRENDGSGSSDQNPYETSENKPKSHDRENDVVAPYIDHRNNNSRINTISKATPEPEPPPEPNPPEKPSHGAAAAVENFRKQLPPEINFRINNAGIRTIVGISDDHIKWAAREAMQSRYTEIKRKIGLFISLCKQEMPPTPPVPAPMEYNSDNDNHCDNHDAYKNLCDINFGEHESKIREYCNKIKRLPKERGVCFPPLGLCKAAMQGGATSITILRALEKTISNWDNVKDNPKGYFEEQCDKEKN